MEKSEVHCYLDQGLCRKCLFDYRNSVFKDNSNLIIWSVKLSFKKGEKSELKNTILKNMMYRQEKHPLECASCGSVFKNISDKNYMRQILDKDCEAKNNIQKWGNKIPTAYLIDRCGLKNIKVGGAMIAEKQPNFILNAKNARAEDVIILIGIIKERVGHKFGIIIEEEVRLIGF